MDNTSILCILILLVLAVSIFFIKDDKSEKYMYEEIPTSPEIEFIEGEPNYHIVDDAGDEIVRSGDLAMDPGFGMGEGTVGFGRYGSSFII